MMAMTLGQRLREERYRLGLTQKEVAKLTGLSIVTILNIENDRQDPHASTVIILCKKLSISADKLFGLTI